MITIYMTCEPEWMRLPIVLTFIVGAFQTARVGLAWFDRIRERIKNRKAR